MGVALVYHLFICIFVSVLFSYKQNKKVALILGTASCLVVIGYFFNLFSQYAMLGFVRTFAAFSVFYFLFENIKTNKAQALHLLKESKYYIYFMFFILTLSLIILGQHYFVVDYTISINDWFNADTTRLFEYHRVPLEMVHPAYGILFGPLIYGLSILSLPTQIYAEAVCTIVNFVQLIAYGFSVVFIGETIAVIVNKKLRRIATFVVFTMYSITAWFVFVPETFAITMFFITFFLLGVAKSNKRITLYSGLLMSLMNIALSPIYLLALLFLYRTRLKELFTKHRAILITSFVGCVVIGCIVAVYACVEYSAYFDLNSIWHNLTSFASKTTPQMMFWPITSVFNGYYLYQVPETLFVSILSTIVYCGVLVYQCHSLYGFVKEHNWEKAGFIGVCLSFLGLQIVLHGILGFGLESQVLYYHLYIPSFFILLVSYLSKINLREIKKYIPAILVVCFISLSSNCFKFLNINHEKTTAAKDLSLPDYEFVIENDGRYYNVITAEKVMTILTESGIYTIADDIDGHAARVGNKLTWMNDDGFVFELIYDENEITILKNGKKEKSYSFENDLKDNYYIFGMGNRDKIIFRQNDQGNFEVFNYSTNEILYENVEVNFNPNYPYQIEFTDIDRSVGCLLLENEKRLEIREDDDIVLTSTGKINIPDEIAADKNALKIFKNVLINIVDGVPYPNFLAYESPWYRDAAMMAMVLEQTDNLHLIKKWVLSLEDLYDYNNGNAEVDNVGQCLYLKSLFADKNDEIVQKMIEQAKSLASDGKLTGLVDYSMQTYYPTAWLKMAFERLGVEYEFDLDSYDYYANISWFVDGNTTKRHELERWQYLHIANQHLLNGAYDNIISYEFKPGKANFKRYNELLNFNADNKMIQNHAWSAAENYLLNYGAE